LVIVVVVVVVVSVACAHIASKSSQTLHLSMHSYYLWLVWFVDKQKQ